MRARQSPLAACGQFSNRVPAPVPNRLEPRLEAVARGSPRQRPDGDENLCLGRPLEACECRSSRRSVELAWRHTALAAGVPPNTGRSLCRYLGFLDQHRNVAFKHVDTEGYGFRKFCLHPTCVRVSC